jgi:hypothetical protein
MPNFVDVEIRKGAEKHENMVAVGREEIQKIRGNVADLVGFQMKRRKRSSDGRLFALSQPLGLGKELRGEKRVNCEESLRNRKGMRPSFLSVRDHIEVPEIRGGRRDLRRKGVLSGEAPAESEVSGGSRLPHGGGLKHIRNAEAAVRVTPPTRLERLRNGEPFRRRLRGDGRVDSLLRGDVWPAVP